MLLSSSRLLLFLLLFSNYAPGILPQVKVAAHGYQQNLWLFNDRLTEVGTMNLFLFWEAEDGKLELFTPEITDGLILPGVTRDSILALTREWNEFRVKEGQVTMNQLVKALKEGRVREMFGAGTATIVSPIKKINYKGQDWNIPLDPQDSNSQMGPLAKRLWDSIMSIQVSILCKCMNNNL